ncbi:hypothetical protein K523DRAFT_363142 [Schizophyllum commune Tattone D]|nr:hypothetical protein K523DRAFT_363142 [Schizophyllum commune Tattone D]
MPSARCHGRFSARKSYNTGALPPACRPRGDASCGRGLYISVPWGSRGLSSLCQQENELSAAPRTTLPRSRRVLPWWSTSAARSVLRRPAASGRVRTQPRTADRLRRPAAAPEGQRRRRRVHGLSCGYALLLLCGRDLRLHLLSRSHTHLHLVQPPSPSLHIPRSLYKVSPRRCSFPPSSTRSAAVYYLDLMSATPLSMMRLLLVFLIFVVLFKQWHAIISMHHGVLYDALAPRDWPTCEVLECG